MRRSLLLALSTVGCTVLPAAPTSAPCAVAEEGGSISGQVRHDETGEPLADALVILSSSSLQEQREGLTNEQGIYAFRDLPPGTYMVQVLKGTADVSKVTTLPRQAKFRANFKLDPDYRRPGCSFGVRWQLDDRSMFSITNETEARLLGVPKTIRRY